MSGTVLVIAALLWVATRPSLAPRPQPALPSLGKDRALPGTSGSVTAPGTGPASQVDRPGPGVQKMEEPSTSHSVLHPPFSALRDLPSASPNPPGRQKTEPAKTARSHIVRPGETLSSIAEQYYGSPSDWRKILTANTKTIKDADKIAPGTKLIIPE